MMTFGSVLVLLLMASIVLGSRYTLKRADLQTRSAKLESQGINVFDLLSSNYLGFVMSVHGSFVSKGTLEIVQLDRATMNNSGRAFSFNHGQRQGYVTEIFREAMAVGVSASVPYGGALKVAVGEDGVVEVADRYRFHRIHSHTTGFGPHAHLVMGEQTLVTPDEIICEKSYSALALGRRYAYTGGCRFVDVTPDNVPNTLVLLPVVCDGLQEVEFQQCASFFLCALDELKFSPDPIPEHGQFRAVAPRNTCSLTGTRPGLQHPKETCFTPENQQQSHCASQGNCSFCGEQGLCCRHPGFRWWFGQYNPELENDGCGKKGCFDKYCCVDSGDHAEDSSEEIR